MTSVMAQPNNATLANSGATPAPRPPLVAFAPLPAAARAALISIARRVRFPADATVLAEGAPADAFYLVWSGQVKMVRPTAAGRTLILALFAPGDLFGVSAALSGTACSASWETVVPTECLEVRRAQLYALLAERPQLVPELLPFLTRQLMECKNCLVETSCARVDARFASLFLGLADRLGEPVEAGTFVPLPLSRQDLADLTGTTLETAIRMMSRWNREGVVWTSRSGFLLRNRGELERLAWGG
jgi:CRP-like cAMP-binding protein